MDALVEKQCWKVLDTHSDKAPIPARAELHVPMITGSGLTCDPDWDPERHVNIIDWPDEEHARASITQVLYAEHVLCMRS